MNVTEFMWADRPIRVVAPITHPPSEELVTQAIEVIRDLMAIILENEKLESTKLNTEEAMVSLAVSAFIDAIHLIKTMNDGTMRMTQ